MDKVCIEAKENIKKGLERLNREPINNENAELYDSLTEALYHLKLVEAMEGSDYEYSGIYHDDMMPTTDTNMNRKTPRWYYSGHSGKDHMMEDLKKMMADADSEKERRRIKDLMEDLEELRK